MARKIHTAEQIIGKLRQVEVMVGQGRQLDEAVREIGIEASHASVLDSRNRSAVRGTQCAIAVNSSRIG